jgi:hypothetical protein
MELLKQAAPSRGDWPAFLGPWICACITKRATNENKRRIRALIKHFHRVDLIGCS